MKNCALLHVLFLQFFFSLISFAQKPPIKLGEIDEKDVKATKYDKFPDAEAIVLCSYGNLYYDFGQDNPKIVVEYIVRIKILKKTGFEYANKTILFDVRGSDKENVSSIKGYTYNMENEKVVKAKLEKSAVSEKMLSKTRGEAKFTMPNVKEGSVIEYSYEIRSDFWAYIPTWYFQQSIPVLWSEYRVSIPEYFEFVRLAQVRKAFDTEESKTESESVVKSQGTMKFNTSKVRWIMKDLPPFKDELFIASANDHIMKMDFQIAAFNPSTTSLVGRKLFLETWEKLIADVMERDNFGKFLNKSIPEKAIIETLTAGKSTNKDKAVAIFEYVKKNIKFNGRTGIYTRKGLKEVWEKKVGNVAEINLLLINMLREAKIEAYPVLSSTRWHGKIFKQYPIIDKFNYVTAFIDLGNNEQYLLDATEMMLAFGMISYQALNDEGFLILKNNQFDWVNMQASKAKISTITIANLSMNKEGNIKGEITDRFGGYEAIRMRRKHMNEAFAKDDSEDESPTITNGTNKDAETKEQNVNKYIFKNLTEIEKPLDASKNIETTEFSQINDDFIYFVPLLNYRLKENPLKAEERDFPVDYACPTEQNFFMNFVIPEGYKVEELPKPMRLKWQDESLKFEYNISTSEDRIQLISKFTINRPIFKVEEYKALRNFYAQIVAKQEEQIVLKKK